MSKISTWSSTAASNNSVSPDGFPEGMAPSGVNNSAREVMAAVRTQHEDAQWIDLGDTPTFTSTTTFTIPGDVTGTYDVNRRLKLTDSSTLYGTITVSAYTSLTTITVVLDSGVLSASLSAVAAGIVSGTNKSTSDTTTNLTVTGDITYQGVVMGTQAVKLNSTILDIGDWDMDTDESIEVAHGLTGAKIRTIEVTIRADSDIGDVFAKLDGDFSSTGAAGSITWDGTDMYFTRKLGSRFNYGGLGWHNATSYNRGWITIWYID